MKNVIASLVAVAGVAAAANAGVVSYQVSNGGAFGASTDALPGQTVTVRVRIAYNGTAPVHAFAGANLQPVASGNFGTAAGADRIVADANNFVGASVGGFLTTPQATVNGDAGQYGRINSFGAASTTTSTAARAFYGTGTAAGLARIAQGRTTNWIGVGTGLNNSTGAGGFNVSQANPGLVPGYPVNPLGNGDDVGGEFVFQFAVLVGDGFNRSISITTASFQTAVSVTWFSNANNFNETLNTNLSSVAGTINVVPAPASLALMGLGGLVAGRRRR